MTEPSELAKALTAFHTSLPSVEKGATNPHFRSKYADLADVVKVVLPALAKQGLAWVSTPRLTENGFVLAYELRHESGETVSGEWPLPDPGSATSQQLGSALTYARRYTLSAVTGIAPDDDDDGNAASQAPARQARAPRPAPQPDHGDRVRKAAAAIREAGTLEALDNTWERVVTSGLEKEPELVTLVADLRSKFGGKPSDWDPVEPVQEWETTEVPK